MVEFYAEEIPGPLGKPSLEKISNYEGLRNWDPTDKSQENPWNLYFEEQRKKKENLKQVVSIMNNITKYMKLN